MKTELKGLVDTIKSLTKDDKRSIFELPIVMKASVPAELYHEKNLKVMLVSMFEVIRSYVKRFTTESEFSHEYSNLLLQQYSKLLRNIIREGVNFPIRDLFRDSTFIFMSGALKRELEDIDCYEEAAVVESITYKLLKK